VGGWSGGAGDGVRAAGSVWGWASAYPGGVGVGRLVASSVRSSGGAKRLTLCPDPRCDYIEVVHSHNAFFYVDEMVRRGVPAEALSVVRLRLPRAQRG